LDPLSGRRAIASVERDHSFLQASPAIADDRPAAGLRFQRYDTEIFFAWKDQRLTAGVDLRQSGLVYPFEKFDILSCLSL
jgi:hypothetical protein